MSGRSDGQSYEVMGGGEADEGGAAEGQTATKQLLGSAGLPCVIYCSTG